MKSRISACGTGEAPTTSGLDVSADAPLAGAGSSSPQATTPTARAAAVRASAMRRIGFLSWGGVLRLRVREAAGEPVARPLQELHQHDEDDHGGDRHLGLVALVAVADGHVAEASAADGAGHRGVADDADR